MSEPLVIEPDDVVELDVEPDELEVVDGAAAPPEEGVLVEPHAANPIGSAAAKATKAVARWALLIRAFMSVPTSLLVSVSRTGIRGVSSPGLHCQHWLFVTKRE
jgi:hypothetical protein